jgi:hypothetical protein
MADLFVWVLDPQKYADAAIHDRYLARLADYRDIVLVVLNHIDTVPEDRREAMVADAERLLAADGLVDVPVLPMSAREGIGTAELEQRIAERVRKKKATRARLTADVVAAAESVREVSGDAEAPGLTDARVAQLEDAFADAAGVPTVVQAVERSTAVRANRATGWPLVSWFSRLRPDPLQRLHLDLGSAGKELTGTARTSLPAPSEVERARVDSAVRAVADDASDGLTRPWSVAVRSASVSRLPELFDRLDAALGDTDLGVQRLPAWVGVVKVLQWVLILASMTGAAWLGLLVVGTYVGVDGGGTPGWGGFPLPALLLVVGVVAGILLALLSRLLVAVTARRRARAADRRLRTAIGQVAQDLVVQPVRGELEAYERTRSGLATALD